ncbi:cytochrome P450 [Laetiporus sulphureus 93-53]|uniref:Cytochrome P450 n=1 Tax=Laetiporus sulphureus 93-53 TaxID=1314785 RepID=A0A165FDG4_9APHY|nr:cytochrome P450 [Laetiporus sulphureus 93-53]KZT08802.1 cytochrome P450 [Laetiporus sulphureus 93-53]
MDSTQLMYTLLIAFPLLIFIHRRSNPLYSIPAVGFSAPLLSYIGAYKFTRNARELLQEGYEKHKGSVFRVPMVDRWLIIFCGAKMNEELRKFPDDEMSFLDAAEEFVQPKYTIGVTEVVDNPIHISVIRGPLTRNLAVLLPGIMDEISVAMEELIPIKDNEWVTVPGLSTMRQVITRTTSRVFVGFPFCRNKEYLDIAFNFTADVRKGRAIMTVTPTILKPLVGRLLPWSRRTIRRFSAMVKPAIEERIKQLEEHGRDWGDKPNNYMTWLVEEAMGAGKTVDSDLVMQALLFSNFAAMHSSSTSITHALFTLAANPEHIHPLREEVESVIKTEGWTRIALDKMWKLDSFMRESQRMNGVACISIIRKALKDVTLSDGTVIPAGTIVGSAADATHYDDESYNIPHDFKPYRFSNMRAKESDRIKHQYVSTSPEYIPFGHGKHACPGRFFVANELKAVLAYIVLNYDVKFGGDGTRPSNHWFGILIVPDPTAEVMFRKRQPNTLV